MSVHLAKDMPGGFETHVKFARKAWGQWRASWNVEVIRIVE